ncbi:hypothetical protein QAD02_017601 [Eretmocerus hayati]|uniref:Uncharacterized protein n=1 Tax=Eretmocerus hayati TaxID=131215 RepID=A0ACC2PES4_9HYME|nr:hypothetical protein QAD02_017601 [Eretmocerus hayati]
MSFRFRYDCTFRTQNLSIPACEDYNKLRKAIRCKDINLVTHLVESGVHTNGKHENNFELTPLHLAVISRCPEIVKVLLDNGAQVNDHDANWDSPLTLAAKTGDTVIIDLLLSYDVQQFMNRVDYLSHLHIACMRNNLDVVKRLVFNDNGEGINFCVAEESPFWAGFTPLHFAVYYGSTETVEFLLKCGVDMMAKDSKKLTPLHWADLRRNEVIIDILLEAHKNEFKNPRGSNGLTHYHIACTRNNPSVVEHFLKLRTDIDLEVRSSNTHRWRSWKPIQLAMYYECPEVIETLLKFKADYKINMVLTWLPDLLEWAFVIKNYTIYDLFVKYAMEPNASQARATNLESFLDFHYACINNDVKEIQKCLANGPALAFIDINKPLWNSYTPLHLATKYNALDATKLLLANGANVMVQNSQKETPLHVAFAKNHREILKCIIKGFPKLMENKVDDVGLSFLHILCTTDEDEIIEDLLRKGADVNIRVNSDSAFWANFTPMHFACKFKQRYIIELLLKYGATIFLKNESISDHFSLVFEEYHNQFFLTDVEELLLKNLLSIFSSQATEMKYSNDCRITPLHLLCMTEGNSESLKRYLVSHQNQINQPIEMPQSRRYNKCTPLHLAMRHRNFMCVQLMIEAGADILAINGAGETPLESTYSTLISFRISDAQVRHLFSSLFSPNELLKPSHFFIACITGAFEFVSQMLNSIDDQELKNRFLNCCNDLNQTPLHYLASSVCSSDSDSSSREQMMQLLLNHGANVNAKDYLLSTPLHCANREEIVLLLIEHKADVDAQDLHGETPLHKICKNLDSNEKSRALLRLLESGADINIEDKEGLTCLMKIEISDGDWSEMREPVIPMLEYVTKLRLIDFDISEENEDFFFQIILGMCEDIFDYDKFEELCDSELERMKLKPIDRYTTVYDILFKSLNDMAVYCENEVLQSIVGSATNDFPIYRFLVHLQMKKGKIRKPLLENSQTSLTLLFKKSLPKACLEMILHHLSNNDLENIVTSVSRSKKH